MKRKNKYPYHIPHGEILIPSMFMLLMGTGVTLWAGSQPVNWLVTDQTIPVQSDPENKKEAEEPESENAEITTPVKKQSLPDIREEQQNQKILKVSGFHMASLFPQGQETSDPSESYGGQAFAALTEKDSRWISGIYGLSKTSPRELAARIGKSAEHFPEDWCKISISFYNGDGTPISGYSNASQILSLASVYSYYHDPENGERFTSYAEELWKRSHSYNFSIGDVYYCDGPCQFSSSKEEEFGDEELAAGSLETLSEANETSEAEVIEEKSGDDNAEAEITMETIIETAPSSMESAAEAAHLSAEELETLLKQSGPAGYTAYLESVSEKATPSEAFECQIGPVAETCKGHVDLQVTASIIGIDEKNRNLFSIDPIGNTEDAITENWNGWTWLPRLYAKSLNSQDWFETYGLSHSSSLYILNPLTSSEINYYMGMLPDGTSDKRRAVIRQALLSVGAIPYYWGGKPTAPGFEGNGFGTITTPDQKGRTLRGLDCSGWINWVYWSALGERLPLESTMGLINCGNGIQRSELQPGDLIIRTGSSAHVYLFLSWASDGSMYVIHETGGITNNVTVSKVNVDWPYYRSLLY